MLQKICSILNAYCTVRTSFPMSPLTPAARAFIEQEADDLVGNLKEELENLVQHTCSDHAYAHRAVEGFLDDLPRHKDRIIDAFVGWKTLNISADVLGKSAGDAKLLRQGKDPLTHESLTEGDRKKKETVENLDEDLRNDGEAEDQEIAENSKTDAARDQRITERDISQNAYDESFVYKDNFDRIPTRAECFRKATQKLFHSIIRACIEKGVRLRPLEDLTIVTRKHIDALVGRMYDVVDELRLPDEQKDEY